MDLGSLSCGAHGSVGEGEVCVFVYMYILEMPMRRC